MKVFVESGFASRAVDRVVNALKKNLPFEVAEDEAAADLIVLHVVGRLDANMRRARRKPYAVIQYALKSTMRPDTAGWRELWQGAQAVWSYYDLPALVQQDGHDFSFPFYHAPLGVDDAFIRHKHPRDYIIATSGASRLAESVREAVLAAERVGRPVFHVGPRLRYNIEYANGCSDEELAHMYSRCVYVSGLRRTEGFELSVIEGLMCGARPVCFDRPHYRQWFEPWAEFIPEGTRAEAVESLYQLFKRKPRPIYKTEVERAREAFDWRRLVDGFAKTI